MNFGIQSVYEIHTDFSTYPYTYTVEEYLFISNLLVVTVISSSPITNKIVNSVRFPSLSRFLHSILLLLVFPSMGSWTRNLLFTVFHSRQFLLSRIFYVFLIHHSWVIKSWLSSSLYPVMFIMNSHNTGN